MAKSVLCVDDSASVRQMVSFTLESAGYAPTTAVDGVDALVKLKAGRFQLIITDLNMPNLDGIGMIKQVRAMPEHAGTPIVMLTTESDEAKKLAGKAAGATGWIVKPFDQARLIAVVTKLIGS